MPVSFFSCPSSSSSSLRVRASFDTQQRLSYNPNAPKNPKKALASTAKPPPPPPLTLTTRLDPSVFDLLKRLVKCGGPNEKDIDNGPQNVMFSRSQSLERPLKEYLENIEQAFIRAKFRQGLFLHPEQAPAPNQNTIVERSSPNNYVSLVQETDQTDEEEINAQEIRDSSDSVSSEAEDGKDGCSFKSISATREVGEVVSEPTLSKPRKGQKRLKKISMRNKKRNTENKGEGMIQNEVWNVEEEVIKVMEMGAQLGLNFDGKEREMAEFIIRKEKEDTDRYGQNGRQ
ncbi:hypothetical protein Q3G72_012543 [Acer saccharum]|nr:hypothetical protein Q3G72_012543 [Acer saccharum]